MHSMHIYVGLPVHLLSLTHRETSLNVFSGGSRWTGVWLCPTSNPHRYYNPTPWLIMLILRCQLTISEMKNSEENAGVLYFSVWSTFHLEVRMNWRGGDGWTTVREMRPPAASICISPVCLHYPWSIALQDVLIAHASKGCLAGEQGDR